MLSFEGWEAQTEAATRKLYGQLRDIDGNRDFPAALRIPAANFYRLLAREKTGAANEFSTIKNLESPNIWVAVPVVYPQFMAIKWEPDERVHGVRVFTAFGTRSCGEKPGDGRWCRAALSCRRFRGMKPFRGWQAWG